MNNSVFMQTSLIVNILFALCFATLITACADTQIVTTETPVHQTHDLFDYDSDGVVKVRDKCGSTVLGAVVDNAGCGKKSPRTEPFNITIHFANNSAVIPNVSFAEIKKMATFLKKHQELNLLITGHTSKVGTAELNQDLSENRARAVVDALVNHFAINSERLSSIGYGFEQLADDGDSPQAHAANRRIQGTLTYNEQVDEMKWTIYSVDDANE